MNTSLVLTLFSLLVFQVQASDEITVCAADDGQFLPQIVRDSQGGVVVVWEDYRTGKDWDVYAQRIDANGKRTWDVTGVPICLEKNNQRTLRLTQSGETVVVTWNDRRTMPDWDVYAQAIDIEGNTLWAKGGVPVCTNGADQSSMVILSDGQGGTIIVWEDERHDSATQDLYMQRLDSNGRPIFEIDGIPIFRSDSLQSNSHLIADGVDGFYVVWWDVVGYDQWHIMVHRLRMNGQPVWETPVIVSPPEGMHGEPHAVADGEGGCIVVWQVYENFINDNFYAQRINPLGKKLWGETGLPVCEADGIQKNVSITPDGHGGVVAVWRDERDVFSDLYAQRISTAGKILWPKNGVPICTAEGHQDSPFLIQCDGDGFFVAWMDYREDYGEESRNAIYGQKIDMSGNALWEKDGIPICTALGDQYPPVVVQSSLGELIVVWSDTRRDLGDVYMRKF